MIMTMNKVKKEKSCKKRCLGSLERSLEGEVEPYSMLEEAKSV